MKDNTDFYVSIIIPAYNEAGRIIPTLQGVMRYLDGRKERYEVLVVDDGSKDATSKIISGSMKSHPCLRLIKEGSNHGKGYAVRRGMLEARGRYLLFMDADLSTPIEELDKLLRFAQDGYQVVIGSRAMYAPGVVVHKTLHRFLMGRIFSVLVGLFAIRGFKDTQCGFKLFSREAARAIFSRQKLNGFSFDVEVLFLARAMGYKIKEVAVNWADSRNTKVRLFSDSLRMFKEIMIIRRMHR